MREDYVLIRVPDGSLAYLTALLVAADRLATATRRYGRAVELDMGVRRAAAEVEARAEELCCAACTPAEPPPTPAPLTLDLPPGMSWKSDHHGGWEVRDAQGVEVGCVVRDTSDRFVVWVRRGPRSDEAPNEAEARDMLARTLRATYPR